DDLHRRVAGLGDAVIGDESARAAGDVYRLVLVVVPVDQRRRPGPQPHRAGVAGVGEHLADRLRPGGDRGRRQVRPLAERGDVLSGQGQPLYVQPVVGDEVVRRAGAEQYVLTVAPVPGRTDAEFRRAVGLADAPAQRGAVIPRHLRHAVGVDRYRGA